MEIGTSLFSGITFGTILCLTPIIRVLISNHSRGLGKFCRFILSIFFSWVGLAAFFVFTQARRGILDALVKGRYPEEDAEPPMLQPAATPKAASRSQTVVSIHYMYGQ